MKDNPFKIKQNSVRDSSVHGFNADRNEGDNLLFMPFFSGWLGKSLRQRNVAIFYLILLTIFSTLFIRLGYLQLFKGQAYYSTAENNRLKVSRLTAPRGILYDRYGEQLVSNVPRFAVYIQPQLISNDEQATRIQALMTNEFPEAREDIQSFFEDYKQLPETLIADNVEYETAIRLMIDAQEMAAIQVAFEPKREYLFDASLGHVLGYVGRITEEELQDNPDYRLTDQIGKTGIEKSYESIIKGKDGFITFEVDALGREKSEIAKVDEVRGTDLTLSIDIRAQEKLHEILSTITEKHDKPAAAGIAMDPQTGEILALVSTPSFDSNVFTDGLSDEEFQELLNNPNKPLFARALSGEYPAGSIFKLAVASAALEEGLISDSFTVQSTGGVQLGNRFFPDWRPGGHGLTNIYHAIADSVNTFFYIIGGGYESTPGLGVDTIGHYARLLGFGQKTGIDIPGEDVGFVPSRLWKEQQGERWYQGDTYNLSIGQGQLLVTPLQVARYTSLFANQTGLVTPHIVMSDDLIQFDTQHGFSSKTIDIVRKGMRRTITNGTAQSMQSVAAAVAGKTGTAQFNRNKDPHSWFTGFAPYDDPEILITVIVEEGGDVGYAVTGARQFLEWYFEKE